MGGKWNRWVTPISDKIDGKKVVRKEYNQWAAMFNRVKCNTYYEEVGLSEMFKSYDLWYLWATQQKGFMVSDVNNRIWSLDKDIIGDGTVYSEDVCVFVPCVINSLFRGSKRETTSYVGVFKESSKKKFKSAINMYGKHKHLGYFDTEIEAHLEYLKARKMFSDNLFLEYGDSVDCRVWDSLFKSCEYSDIPDISKVSN